MCSHSQAVERLITKLILKQSLIGVERDTELARLVQTFWSEHTEFLHHTGKFDKAHIWISAEQDDMESHMWHAYYSVPVTSVLGRLACFVLSKILGCGSAERNWKVNKRMKKRSPNLANEKAKKQTLIYCRYQALRAEHKKKQLSAAGKLWEDEDFVHCKMDQYGRETENPVVSEKEDDVRIFRAWAEQWESTKIAKNGCAVLEARLAKKYGGLKWWDIDEANDDEEVGTARKGARKKKKNEPVKSIRTAHPTKMYFHPGGKGEGKNRYAVIGMMEGFDMAKSLKENDDFYDVWDRNEDFFGQVVEYYEDGKEVKCYEEGGECSSDED